eukprot:TRINITY_DN9915_c0_g1_i1.p1 TRINITY_DN9915_c0_g1~~TRINITY_DN9915_c0_g1_i1.p1  ORF type:complete len:138 (-),score=24.08 TRINITY_DN9915_c0_g1_i1:36-449(-)
MAFDQGPTFMISNDSLSEIFSYIKYRGSQWLLIKLVCKRWNHVGDRTFDPNLADAWWKTLCWHRFEFTNERKHPFLITTIKRQMYLNRNQNSKYHERCWKTIDKLLDDHRVDPSQEANLAIFLACKYGQTELSLIHI